MFDKDKTRYTKNSIPSESEKMAGRDGTGTKIIMIPRDGTGMK